MPVSMKRDGDAAAATVIDNREAWKLAIKYDLTMAQVRGLIEIHGNDMSKLTAAAKRLTAKE
jgi:hypothetical protein